MQEHDDGITSNKLVCVGFFFSLTDMFPTGMLYSLQFQFARGLSRLMEMWTAPAGL